MGTGSKKSILVLAGLCALAGCSTYSLKELRHTTPKGNAFQTALSRLYMDYAIQEEKNYDWFTSMYFADKGLVAAYGKDVEPEQPESWNVSKEVLPTMQQARKILVDLLNERNKRDYPQVTARALYYFDCWVEQQDDGWQSQDIAQCRDGLQDAFERLNAPDIQLAPMVNPESSPPFVQNLPKTPEQERVEERRADSAQATEKPVETASVQTSPPAAELLAQAPEAAEQSTVAERVADTAADTDSAAEIPAASVEAPSNDSYLAAAEAPAAQPTLPAGVDTSSYMVFFDDKRTTLPDEGRKVVDEIAKNLNNTSDYSVVIGANQHVEFVSERAESVKKRLVEGGVNASAITVSVAQVPDFMADSGEGDSAPIRHRVEIYLNQ